MISIEELRELLVTQFGIYLNVDEYEHAFQKSLQVLSTMDHSENADVFYAFIHTLILDILERMEVIEKAHVE